MTDDGTHFGTDEEILSAYVLGRLPGAEREKVDRHAASCASCAASLRREMIVAAGVRRLGREMLRADLRKRIAERDSPGHWARITGAAAALCIVAGMGAYYILFNRGVSPAAGNALSPPAGETKGEIAQRQQSSARDGLARTGAGDKAVQAPAAVPSPALTHAEAKQKVDAGTLQMNRYNALKEETSAGGAARGEPLAGAAQAPEEFWSEGIVERENETPAPAAVKKSAADESAKSLLFKSDVQAGAQRKDAPAAAREEYLVRQKAASALPYDRGGSAGNRTGIPTRVEQKGEQTTLTMYLDSLVDENEVKRARVEAIGDDSVVVTIGGKKILYRIPRGPGTQAQQPRK